MILSDREIILYLDNGLITIDPKPDLNLQLGSCSIDFKLGNTFRVFKHNKYPYIDLKSEINPNDLMKQIDLEDNDGFIMQPGEFVLAVTKEELGLPDDLMARLEGRSSLARLGIIVHSTAGVFNPGWVGKATLELGNLGKMPVKLYPGMRICSFTFARLSSKARRPYGTRDTDKYMDQDGPEVSRFGKDPDLSDKSKNRPIDKPWLKGWMMSNGPKPRKRNRKNKENQ